MRRRQACNSWHAAHLWRPGDTMPMKKYSDERHTVTTNDLTPAEREAGPADDVGVCRYCGDPYMVARDGTRTHRAGPAQDADHDVDPEPYEPYCPWCVDGRDTLREGEEFCRNPGCKPDRPDADGGRTDGFALTDAPVYLEHGNAGDDPDSGPTLGLDFTIRPDEALLVDLTTGDEFNEPDMRDGVLEVVERTLADRYAANIPEGYGVDVRLSGDGYMWRRDNREGCRAEVFVTIEMWGGPYRDDPAIGKSESAEDWIERTAKACRYHRIVDELHMFYTGQREVENALRAHLGRPPMCVRCNGTGTAQLHYAPYEEPCDRCGATGDEPEDA